MISLSNVSKKYRNEIALDNISLSIKQNEMIAVLGPNGAGKTTLIKILTGYFYPTSGSVTICGYDITKNPIEVKKNIGYVPEDINLYGDHFVDEYLRYSAESKGINKKYIRKAVDNVIDQCDLQNICYKLIDSLSKGFRQKVAIAQAIINKPPILIFDEPTSGLDLQHKRWIRDFISSMNKKRTIVISSHELHEIEELCSTIILIKDGKIINKGSINKIKEIYTKKTIYKIGVKGKNYEEIINVLKTKEIFDKLIDIKPIDSKKLHVIAEVILKREKDSSDIYHLFQNMNMILTEMTPLKISLEDVFITISDEYRGSNR